MKRRGSGVLLHVTSLPSPYGIGDLGPGAQSFIDFLVAARQGVWQILPLGPTSPAIGNSPYSSSSAFAGNPLLINPDILVDEGRVTREEADAHLTFAPQSCDYESVETYKKTLLHHAYRRARLTLADDPEYQRFRAAHAHWLDDFALFTAIKDSRGGQMWNQWPAELRDRDADALATFRTAHADDIEAECFRQYLFFSQWQGIKDYANQRSIHIIGDAPIYVTYDSADVWCNPHLFKLDAQKNPTHVAGVPPDYFSATGQLWGNPVYNWEAIRDEHFGWWLTRIAHNLALYDYIRIDHFRGFAGYWEIPAGEETAINGEWVDAPGMEFFDALAARFSSLPIIAEDLGVITPDVRELRDTFRLPGMKILQFSFGHGMGQNPDAQHNHVHNCIAYTGTHDNNTTRGWFAQEASEGDRHRLNDYVGHPVSEETVAPELVRLALQSVARLAVFPMQDLLNLPADARMNTPSKANGNWRWRVTTEQLSHGLQSHLAYQTELFGRDNG